jgi:hypothetical protein
MLTLESLNASALTAHLGQNFAVTLMVVSDPLQPPTRQTFEMELASIELLPFARAGQRDPFSIVFLGTADAFYLPQHTYVFEHAKLGALELFVSPIGPDITAQRMRYEAIIA